MRLRNTCSNRAGRSSGARCALKTWRDERGTQLVELAIVMPILLLLLGATAEFGRFFHTYTTLLKGTRAAARYIVSQPPGEGTAAAWPQVVSLLRDAIDDADGPSVHSGRARAQRVDSDLHAARIGPGHPSLYPGGHKDAEA